MHPWTEYGDEAAKRARHKSLGALLQRLIDRDKADDWLAAGLLALVSGDMPFAKDAALRRPSRWGPRSTLNWPGLPMPPSAMRGDCSKRASRARADAALAHVVEMYGKVPWFASHKPAVDAAVQIGQAYGYRAGSRGSLCKGGRVLE